MGESRQSGPCINCGWCGRACREKLLPQIIHKRLFAGRLEDARAAGLANCTLCGRCGPVCPARIDLPAQFALAKKELCPAKCSAGQNSDGCKPASLQTSPGEPGGRQTSWTIRRIMLVWLIGLAPLAAGKIILAGWWGAAHLLTACAACVAVEQVFALLRKKRAWGGAIVAGLVFAMPVSPEEPLWISGLGAAFGMVFGREIFGGLGRGLFHPAVLGWCFLSASYGDIFFSIPLETSLIWPISVHSAEAAKWAVFFFAPLALFCWKRIANIVSPVVFILLTMAISWSGGDFNAKSYAMFAAIFILADMTTGSATGFARILEGAISGLLTVWLYSGGNWANPQTLFFILLMVGVFSPLFDEAGLWLRSKVTGPAGRLADAN